MRPAKKKSTKNTEITEGASREELTELLKSKGPYKLKKYAVSNLGIDPDVVDEWTDVDYMVDYCVAKKLGEDLPTEEGEVEREGEGEFDASEFLDNLELDDEMEKEERSGEPPFAPPEEESDPVMAPAPAKKPKRGRKKKEETSPSPQMEISDVASQLQGVLDLFTGQGTVLDQLREEVREVKQQQQDHHRMMVAITGTMFKVSSILDQFIPRALKAMRFKPSVAKDVLERGEEARRSAESSLDPEED